MAGTLVIAPGCTKRTKLAPEQMNSKQLEKERKKYKMRGIGLTTAGSVVIAGSAATIAYSALGNFGVGGCGELCMPAGAIALLIGCVAGTVGLIGGSYMLGQGIHDLAKAKKLRRIQMKEAAQKRKLEHEAQEAQAVR